MNADLQTDVPICMQSIVNKSVQNITDGSAALGPDFYLLHPCASKHPDALVTGEQY